MCWRTRYALRRKRGFISYLSPRATYRIAQRYIDFAVRQKYRVAQQYIDKGGIVMEDTKNQLREDSITLALTVSDACDEIKNCSVFTNQLLRAASSVGANIHEARYAHSRADFVSKLEIALKECSETEYWLELLFRKTKLSNSQYTFLRNQCGSIRRRLIASITTAKSSKDL
jgi:four helix bundle protein